MKNGWNPRKMGVKPPFTRKMGGEYSPQLVKEEKLSVGASGDCSPTTLYFFCLINFFYYLCPMNKEFVTYEIALELKQLGFDEFCVTSYGKFSHLIVTPFRGCHNSDGSVTVPTFSQVFRWFEENYSYFVDVKTDTTPNEILGFDYTIKSWKFPPMVFDFFKDKREGNIAVINKMIEMVKKEKQKEILIDLMNMDDVETKTHLSVGEKMIKMVRDAKQKSINKKNK